MPNIQDYKVADNKTQKQHERRISDRLLTKKRAIIETVNDELKNIALVNRIVND